MCKDCTDITLKSVRLGVVYMLKFVCIATIFLFVLALPPVHAGVYEYNFYGHFTTAPYEGLVFSGSFRYDDTDCVWSGSSFGVTSWNTPDLGNETAIEGYYDCGYQNPYVVFNGDSGVSDFYVDLYFKIDWPGSFENFGPLPLDDLDYGAVEQYGASVYREGVIDSVTLDPTISVSTNQDTYEVGDNMEVSLHVINGDAPAWVWVLVCLQLPDGSFYPDFAISELMELPEGLDFEQTIFSVTLPSIPLGVYTWYAGLVEPMTLDVIGVDTAEWEFVGPSTVKEGSIDAFIEKVRSKIE